MSKVYNDKHKDHFFLSLFLSLPPFLPSKRKKDNIILPIYCFRSWEQIVFELVKKGLWTYSIMCPFVLKSTYFPAVINDWVCVLSRFSCVGLFVTPWTVAHQASLSKGFSRKVYWSGLPCPPPGDLPNLGITPNSLMSPALAGSFFTTSATWEAHSVY